MAQKMILTILVVMIIGVSIFEGPKTKRLCEGFLPQNDLKIPVQTQSAAKKAKHSGLTLREFNEVLDRLDKLYGKTAIGILNPVTINRHWEDGTVNAMASIGISGELSVDMFGGMARLPSMTKDGFTVVACHEIGHHLGGGPNYWDYSSLTVEGEADYFATLKCLKRFFAEDNLTENNWLLKKVNTSVYDKCQEVYSNTDEQNYCIRSSYAGLNLARTIQKIKFYFKSMLPKFNSFDPKVVASTYPDHSEPQCRLDTFLSGARCPVPVTEERTPWDYKTGACSDEKSTPFGLRPRCWFNPDFNYKPAPHKGR